MDICRYSALLSAKYAIDLRESIDARQWPQACKNLVPNQQQQYTHSHQISQHTMAERVKATT